MLDTLSVLRGLPAISEKYRAGDWFQQENYYPVYTKISGIVNPDVILEIGTLHGCSLISLLNGNTSTNRVFWIDDESYEKGSNARCAENLNHYLAGRPVVFEYKSLPFDALYFNKYKIKNDDLLLMHIDGEHTVNGKLRDLLIADSIRPDILLVDDYTYSKDVSYAVDLWGELTDKKFITLNTYRGMVVYVYNDSRRGEWEEKIGSLL